MAMIKCAECSRDISDKAVSCPHCGAPLQPRSTQVTGTVVIESTSKTWKLVWLISSLSLFTGLGLVGLNFGRPGPSTWLASIGILMASFGFIGMIAGKFGAWWNHR